MEGDGADLLDVRIVLCLYVSFSFGVRHGFIDICAVSDQFNALSVQAFAVIVSFCVVDSMMLQPQAPVWFPERQEHYVTISKLTCPANLHSNMA